MPTILSLVLLFSDCLLKESGTDSNALTHQMQVTAACHLTDKH